MTTAVWITKYALTTGIEKANADIYGSAARIGGRYSSSYYHGKDWHRSREAAVARAEEMRVAKIASLKKQIEKLEGVRFE